MTDVGVREFRQRASEILREVRDKKLTITITHRGKPVAKLVPVVDLTDSKAEALAVMAEMDELAKEISALWPQGVSAVDAVREQRREL